MAINLNILEYLQILKCFYFLGDLNMNESRAVAAYLVNKYAESDKLYPKVYSNKMCIKSAPYLYQKSANWALNTVLFYDLKQMLLPKFLSNSKFQKVQFRHPFC